MQCKTFFEQEKKSKSPSVSMIYRGLKCVGEATHISLHGMSD